jgi:hypothetical protein
MDNNIRDAILEATEASLEAQLNSVRRLRKKDAEAAAPKRPRGQSQIGMVFDVLKDAGQPLHLNEIISRVNARFATKVDPDSLGSALTKRVVKGQVFCRPDKNTFALVEENNAG